MKATIKKIEGNKITFDSEEKPGNIYPLADWVKSNYVKLGEAEIEVIDNQISFVLMSKLDVPKKPVVGSKKWEDDMVTFEDLLTKAHDLKVPFSIKTECLNIDLEKKYALFKARVIVDGEKQTIFEGHGDATSDNVTGEFIKPHFIRMAETRSIVRALRWYTNNGCAEEEK